MLDVINRVCPAPQPCFTPQFHTYPSNLADICMASLLYGRSTKVLNGSLLNDVTEGLRMPSPMFSNVLSFVEAPSKRMEETLAIIIKTLLLYLKCQ